MERQIAGNVRLGSFTNGSGRQHVKACAQCPESGSVRSTAAPRCKRKPMHLANASHLSSGRSSFAAAGRLLAADTIQLNACFGASVDTTSRSERRGVRRRPLQRDRHVRDAKRSRSVGLPALVEYINWWTGDNERSSDCASSQSHCWPNAGARLVGASLILDGRFRKTEQRVGF